MYSAEQGKDIEAFGTSILQAREVGVNLHTTNLMGGRYIELLHEAPTGLKPPRPNLTPSQSEQQVPRT